LFNYFSFFNVTQLAKKLGINPSLMRQYKSGKAYISDKQAAKIEEGIHRLGQQLLEIKIG
jgi:ribosome-binding protein aMBF1 (putative translation factor)